MKVDRDIQTAVDFQRVVEQAVYELHENTGITVKVVMITSVFDMQKHLQHVTSHVEYQS